MHFTTIDTAEQFSELFEAYWELLYQRALQLTGNASESEEHVQELFFRLWNMKKSIQVKQDWKHYLLVALKHQVFHAKKKNSAAHDFYFPVREDGTSLIEAKFGLVELYSALGGLTASQRLVFILHRIKGFTTEEISSLLSISSHTVKSHLRSSRSKVRELSRHFTSLF